MSSYYSMKTVQQPIKFFLLFCLSFNIYNLAPIYLTLLIICYVAETIFTNIPIRLDNPLKILMLFSLSYFVVYCYHYDFSIEYLGRFLVGPTICYVTGNQIVKQNCSEKTIYFLIAVIAIGLFMYGLLNIIFTISIHGSLEIGRTIYDFWNQNTKAATGQGLFYTYIISFFSANITAKKVKKKSIDFIAIFAGFFSIWSSILSGTRGQLVIVPIVIVFCYMMNNNGNKLRISIKILLIIVVSILVYQLNLFYIKDFIVNSSLFQRESGSASNLSGRTDIYKSFLEQFIYYPFGGKQIKLFSNFGFVHNVWLDIYYSVGFLPFILFVIYTVMVIQRMFIFVKCNCSNQIKALVCGIYIGVFANFAIEPVMEGYIYFFMLFFVINGAIHQFIKKSKNNKVSISQEYQTK